MSGVSHLAPLPTKPVRRLAFLGTPRLASGVLASLVEHDFEIALAVTMPDKRRGRGGESSPSPVKSTAEKFGVRVVHDVDELLVEHRRRPIDLGVVVAFGALIKPHILAEIPMVNLHVSLLPRWRGAAPIERAILAGDDVTGVCLMQLDSGLDTGGVISSFKVPIESSSTAASLGESLMREGTRLLIDACKSGAFACIPQSGEPTYAAKIESTERRIDWAESAAMVSRRVRIGDAWTTLHSRRLKVHSVELSSLEIARADLQLVDGSVHVGCGDGSVRLVQVQPEGRQRLDAETWARGARIASGDSFDGP